MRRFAILVAFAAGVLVIAPSALAGAAGFRSAGADAVRSLLATTTQTDTTQTATTGTATTQSATTGQDGQQQGNGQQQGAGGQTATSVGTQIASGFSSEGQTVAPPGNGVQAAATTPPANGTADATSAQTPVVAASDPLGGSDQSTGQSTDQSTGQSTGQPTEQSTGGSGASGAGGGGGGNDPCSGKNPPPICSQAPETPFPLLYPAAAAAALAVYLLIERRRRRSRPLAG